MRKYWITFQIITDKPIGTGHMMVNREMPISSDRSLVECAQAIKQALEKEGAVQGPFNISVLDWHKFEEESILLPS